MLTSWESGLLCVAVGIAVLVTAAWDFRRGRTWTTVTSRIGWTSRVDLNATDHPFLFLAVVFMEFLAGFGVLVFGIYFIIEPWTGL